MTILHTTCRLHGQKNHILRNILKFQNVKFECFLILNENIRIWDKGSIYFQLRLDKYKMIAKMLWALMKPRSRHNSTKKKCFKIFFFLPWHYCPSPSTTHSLVYRYATSRNTEIHPSPMRDVVIEQKQLSSSTNTQPFYQTGQTSQVPWHSGNYRVQIHSETRAWHDNNIQP